MLIRKKCLISICFLLSVAFVAGVSITFSKYIGSANNDVAQNASNFHFNSDLLTSAGATYSLNNQNSFQIEVKNFENALNFTDHDIKFNVSVSGAVISGGSPVDNVYTISGGGANYINLTVTPNSSVVSISVSSSSPYEKTLSAIFNVSGLHSSYQTTELSTDTPYLTLTLNIGFNIPTITINWDTTVFDYDNTNQLLQTATQQGTTGSVTLTNANLTSGITYNLMFFKKVEISASAIPSTNIQTATYTITLPE